MNRLIITSNRRIVSYDTETKEPLHDFGQVHELVSDISKEVSGRPPYRPFGITNDEQNLYVASNNKIGVFDKEDYQFKSLLNVYSLVNTHQILKNGDMFYVTNSANDSIGFFNLKTGERKYLDVNTFTMSDTCNETSSSYEFDICHVNSLCLVDNKLYFCLHNKGKKLSGYYYYDMTSSSVNHVVDAGVCGHNIVIVEGFLYTLSTGTGELVKVNLETKQTSVFKIIDNDNIFLRGLDFHNGQLLIGYSNDHGKQPVMQQALITKFDIKTHQNEIFMKVLGTSYINDLKVI